MPVNGMTCLSSSTLKRATPPVPPSIKLGGNGFTTKIAVGGEWEVAPITHPMIMSFDGMTNFLHQRLMKCRRNLQLRGLMKTRKPAHNKESRQENLQGLGADPLYTLGDFSLIDYTCPLRKSFEGCGVVLHGVFSDFQFASFFCFLKFQVAVERCYCRFE